MLYICLQTRPQLRRLIGYAPLPLPLPSSLSPPSAPLPPRPGGARRPAAHRPPATPPPSPSTSDDTQTLKVNVNLVNVYFSVRDKNGFITNLHKDDCTVLEDKSRQTIKNFTQEKNLPLTIGILLDTSGSQTQRPAPRAGRPAPSSSRTSSPPRTKPSSSPSTSTSTCSPTTPTAPASSSAPSTRPTSTPAPAPARSPATASARGTLLYDAVYLAAHDKLRQEAGRKILVLLTDGGDQGSQETLKSAIEAAQKANAIVYVILIADRGFYGGGFGSINLADTGARDMEQLATETGGRVINVGNNGKKLEDAFDQIQDELRTQYLASYTPTNPKIDGTFRNLNIACQPRPEGPGPQRLLRHGRLPGQGRLTSNRHLWR